MRIYSESNTPIKGTPTPDGWDMVLVESDSKSGKYYRVDVTFGRCNCPAWTHQKGERKPCKHLRALGFKEVLGTNVDLKEPGSKAGFPRRMYEILH